MSGGALLYTTPSASVASAMHFFDRVTGVPVLDDHKHPIGMLSEKDVIRMLQRSPKLEEGALEKIPVREAMHSPAISIREKASAVNGYYK